MPLVGPRRRGTFSHDEVGGLMGKSVRKYTGKYAGGFRLPSDAAALSRVPRLTGWRYCRTLDSSTVPDRRLATISLVATPTHFDLRLAGAVW